MCNIKVEDLHDLLEIFEKKSFEAGSDCLMEQTITSKCEKLFKLDCNLIELDNSNGALSSRYPGRIFIPKYESCSNTSIFETSLSNNIVNGSGIQAYVTFANSLENQIDQPSQSLKTHFQCNRKQPTIYEDLYDNKVRELITMAKYARCRQRFPVPVILYRGKYICRSATISVLPETYGRKVVDFAYDCINGTNYTDRSSNMEDELNSDPSDESLINNINDQQPSPFCYEEVIKSDIELLKALNVKTIVDLMVEKRKIKYFMPVSSSEKADPENHYKSFNLLSLPYPGCEFLRKFRDNNYMAENLYYNWSQTFNDANINIPELGPAKDLNIFWNDYDKWDLVLITQNYLKAMLRYIQKEKSGLLIHCISGWDRTPLFISLIRLSLWADGLIHQTLDPYQMAYLTLAYDWFLFGHQLSDRLKRGEEIMFFCFHVLKHITEDEFSVTEERKHTKTPSSSDSSSSVIVIKSDCCDDEQLKEDILNLDQDSNDSFSNYSNCDIPITDNFYATTKTAAIAVNAATPFTNSTSSGNTPMLTSRSPNLKRSKTSPISVPGANALARQRQESTSSNGSWQVVTDTGSIDSVMNGSCMARFVTQQDNLSIHSGNACFHICGNVSNNSSLSSNNGTTTDYITNGSKLVNNSTSPLINIKSSVTLRKKRLDSVRAIFIQAYGKTVGLKFKEGSAMNLTTFIGTLADQLF